MRAITIATTALALAGCTDFDLPSALTREQVVAVRATPASPAPGTRARLDALIAGPHGIVDEAELTWSLAEPADGAAIEVDPDGSAWLAIAADREPGPVAVALAVSAASGDAIDALKTVEVRTEERDNPGPMGVRAGDQPVADAELRVAVGSTVVLTAEPEGVESPQVSWYATVGEIELYRRNPTELVAPAEPDEGWLIAVVRDGAGGVTWQIVSLVVDQATAAVFPGVARNCL
jgi:hypothetical protein